MKTNMLGYVRTIAHDDRPWGGTGPPAVAYTYGRGAMHALARLKGYRGIVQCDGYAAYKTIANTPREEAITLALCWAHLRRRFLDDGRIELDTNIVERSIHPLILNRKPAPASLVSAYAVIDGVDSRLYASLRRRQNPPCATIKLALSGPRSRQQHPAGGSAATPAPDRIVRLKTVLDRTGPSRSTVYRKIAEGTFPPRIKISVNGAGWRESDINRWIADPVAATGGVRRRRSLARRIMAGWGRQ